MDNYGEVMIQLYEGQRQFVCAKPSVRKPIEYIDGSGLSRSLFSAAICSKSCSIAGINAFLRL